MLLVLLIYVISVLSWGTVFFQLMRIIVVTTKLKSSRPSLLIPLTIASLALFVESIYFGISAYFGFIGNSEILLAMHEGNKWVLVNLLIALSGVLLMLNLRVENKK